MKEDAGELRKHGIKIKLHTQPFQVLLFLLERPTELITRKEMQDRLWGRDTFVDFDHGLNTAINKIREALDDSAAQPRYIETVPGKGYRFIAPVSLTGTASPQPETPGQPSDDLPTASRRTVRVLLFLIQIMYLGFYFGALGNLAEIREIFVDANLLPHGVLMGVLVATAVLLIPVRLFIAAAVVFDFPRLPEKFRQLFPWLAPFELLWALSPFLLVHHLPAGVALGICAALVYMPFTQRSLMLMYAKRG